MKNIELRQFDDVEKLLEVLKRNAMRRRWESDIILWKSARLTKPHFLEIMMVSRTFAYFRFPLICNSMTEWSHYICRQFGDFWMLNTRLWQTGMIINMIRVFTNEVNQLITQQCWRLKYLIAFLCFSTQLLFNAWESHIFVSLICCFSNVKDTGKRVWCCSELVRTVANTF